MFFIYFFRLTFSIVNVQVEATKFCTWMNFYYYQIRPVLLPILRYDDLYNYFFFEEILPLERALDTPYKTLAAIICPYQLDQIEADFYYTYASGLSLGQKCSKLWAFSSSLIKIHNKYPHLTSALNTNFDVQVNDPLLRNQDLPQTDLLEATTSESNASSSHI